MPTAGNLVLPLLSAIATIIESSTAVATLVGARTTKPYIVPFEDINGAEDLTEFELPLFVYDLVTDTPIGPMLRERRVTMNLDAIAEGNGALTMVTEMLAIARNELTWAAFNGQGLDAFVEHPIVHQPAPADPQQTRGLVMHRLQFSIRATAP